MHVCPAAPRRAASFAVGLGDSCSDKTKLLSARCNNQQGGLHRHLRPSASASPRALRGTQPPLRGNNPPEPNTTVAPLSPCGPSSRSVWPRRPPCARQCAAAGPGAVASRATRRRSRLHAPLGRRPAFARIARHPTQHPRNTPLQHRERRALRRIRGLTLRSGAVGYSDQHLSNSGGYGTQPTRVLDIQHGFF